MPFYLINRLVICIILEGISLKVPIVKSIGFEKANVNRFCLFFWVAATFSDDLGLIAYMQSVTLTSP